MVGLLLGLINPIKLPPPDISEICPFSIVSEELQPDDNKSEREAFVGEYMGSYELTAYIATGNPCADGVYPEVNHTAASNDPALWHHWIHIEGYGDYYIHDTGGMADNVIDIFMGSYDEAIQFGRREAEVYIIE
jgi:3D (Asp-Asp-Asp) domain-containing protein